MKHIGYSADELREKFLNFFSTKGHRIVESDSLVPADDPTVLFTPAGMNQFKKQFLGMVTDFRRAASSQRCLRTDDLEKVGKTDCHHTFFEMLGNFSFGDYFKEEAIAWAWEFLTRELNVDPERLWVSVYKDDEEAYNIWRDAIKVPPERIVKLGDKDNFWPSEAKEKGPNGPCGPCSEIFIDFGPGYGCKKEDCSPACSCGRFVEVWNLVFTQFNRKEGGELVPLPQKNIDTGMGLERLTAVMQGVRNNFQTDLFEAVIKEIRCAAKRSPNNSSVYAVADHIRAIVFSIYDGILPSNEGRGYVVRKLIRRSILHLRVMGIDKVFLYKLVPVLTEIMKSPYPELAKRREDIAAVILAEENNFNQTLNSRDGILENKYSQFIENQDPRKAGIIAFTLYDTYGIPFELTKEWLNEKQIKYLEEAFYKEMESQKNRSKSGSQMKGDVFGSNELKLDVKDTEFLGYKELSNQAKLLKIIIGSKESGKAEAGAEAVLVLDKTVFYAESGGQAADTGIIKKNNAEFRVTDTQKSGNVVMHKGLVEKGSFSAGDEVEVSVDVERRLSIARNHTSTHLLQAALRKVLGEHVQQQGSLVEEEKFRFDFTHFRDVKDEELFRIEELVNGFILSGYPVEKKEMSLDEARREGALAFFGEKYSDKVRVISINGVSKELCAGTHLDNTGQAGLFKIIQEGSVASGVRRIEAITGSFAHKLMQEHSRMVSDIAGLLNVPSSRIMEELQKKTQLLKGLEKQLYNQRLKLLESTIEATIAKARKVNGRLLVAEIIDDSGMELLRRATDIIKAKVSGAVIALASRDNGKALLVVGVTKDICGTPGMDAKELVRKVAPLIGGSGGGRSDFAQAGGDRPEKLPEVFNQLYKLIEESRT